jgi:hypothetical protein
MNLWGALEWVIKHGGTIEMEDGAPTIVGVDGYVPDPVYRTLKENRDDIPRLIGAKGASAPAEETSLPVRESYPEPLAEAALHGLAGDFVKAVRPHTEADDVALLTQFLAAFGNVIGRGPHFMAEADRHYTNLFLAIVADSSKGRKGTSWGLVRHIYAAVDSIWTDDRIQDGLSSGEGLIHAVRDQVTGSERDKRTGTVTEIVVDDGVADKRLLIQAPEFASVLQAQSREGNTLSAIMRTAWDTGRLQVLTRKSPLRATDAHVSIVAHVTREELLRLFRDTDAANGYGNRICWFAARRARLLPDGGMIKAEGLAPLTARLYKAIKCASGVTLMRRDEEARALWHRVYPDLSGAKPGLLGAIVARAEAQTMRLACLYALLDQSAVIEADHLKAALALWRYSEQSARWIFGDALGDPTADEILRALRATPAGLTRTEISTLFRRHKNAAEIGRALAVLADRGLARVAMLETGGRREERWHAEGEKSERSEKR